MKNRFRCSLLVVFLIFIVSSGKAQFTQQGGKLVGSGVSGTAQQGFSVSISSDGNTAIVGGPYDNHNIGSVWIYTRSGGVWTQLGDKLIGTGAMGNALQGYRVSISGDGNTAIVGGPYDNTNMGAAWVYTRSSGIWTQQGSKLVGTGAAENALQGTSVSISADGNTAIVGGYNDSNGVGATWIYTRSDSVWAQQGSKLVGTGAIGPAGQGYSVSISADGNTAIVGGYYDKNYAGAAWVYARSGGIWKQQGSKLVGAAAVGPYDYQGCSVSISADGNTAIVGGYNDSNGVGAVWVYTRSDSVWTQQGSKLVGTGAVGAAEEGISVALSADGNTAIAGGYVDNGGAGATWVYTRKDSVWTQRGSKLVGTGAVGVAFQGQSVSLSGDGNTAIVGGYNDNGGVGAAWIYNNSVTAVHEHSIAPLAYRLLENYPNPFNPTTKISYTLAKVSTVTLTIYDILGQRIATLVNGKNEPGEHSISWNALNVPSGIYFYRIVAEDFVQTKKMVVMK